MPVQACPNVLRDCDCSGYPVRNFSSEDPDVPVFFGNYPGPPDGPLGGDPKYTTEGCLEICESSVSQAAADECALLQEQECAVGPGGTLYRNSVQECDRPCPDGTSFVGSTLAGEVASPWQADADARAYSLACERARLGRICFTTTLPLTPACKNEYFELQLVASGGTPWLVTFGNHVFLPGTCFSETAIGDIFALAWEVTAGSLPAGLALVCTSGLIVGTPTVAGSSSFTVRVTDGVGGYQTRAFVLRVVSIDSPVALPAVTVGTAYTYTLLKSGTTGTVTWSLATGSLPPGLSLSAAGVISGTPTAGADSYTFTLDLLDGGGASCSKEFSIGLADPCDSPFPASLSSSDGQTAFNSLSEVPLSTPICSNGPPNWDVPNDGGFLVAMQVRIVASYQVRIAPIQGGLQRFCTYEKNDGLPLCPFGTYALTDSSQLISGSAPATVSVTL